MTFSGGSTASFLMVQPPNQADKIILGASFTRNIGGKVVDTSNQESEVNSNLSAAAIISNQSLIGVTSLNMMIIDDPTAFKNIDNSNNKILASSIIVIAVKRNNTSPTPLNISLYFQVLNDYKLNSTGGEYYCSFYDENSSRWNESGCTRPEQNDSSKLYKCSCNHTTTFALLWSPQVLTTTTFSTTTATTSPPYTPDGCSDPNQIKLLNGTCISKLEATV